MKTGILILLACLAAHPADGLTSAESKLGSNSWMTRREGFVEVMNLPEERRTGGMKAALVRALERENALAAGAATLGEDFSTYYSGLIEAVAAMKDPAAANALLGALGMGRMAADGLAAIGEAAVEPALAMLESTGSRRTKRDLCKLLRRLEAPAAGLSRHARSRIGEALGACDRQLNP